MSRAIFIPEKKLYFSVIATFHLTLTSIWNINGARAMPDTINGGLEMENRLVFSNKGNALIARDHQQTEREVCVTILESENDAITLAMSLMAVLNATPVSFTPFGKQTDNGDGCTDTALCGDIEWGGPAQPTLDDPDDNPDSALDDRPAPIGATLTDEDTGVEYPNTDSDTVESETVGS